MSAIALAPSGMSVYEDLRVKCATVRARDTRNWHESTRTLPAIVEYVLFEECVYPQPLPATVTPTFSVGDEVFIQYPDRPSKVGFVRQIDTVSCAYPLYFVRGNWHADSVLVLHYANPRKNVSNAVFGSF